MPPTPQMQTTYQVHRLAPFIVHPLPGAPMFTGRELELSMMREFWKNGTGVLSLIGLGGAGKTALSERFLSWLLENESPDGVLVWSFYDDPDANHFLKTAHNYFTGGEEVQAVGAGWFHMLSEALATGGNYLLVLDGLERVQRQQTDASGIYGELEDPLLRGLLSRLCAGTGNTRAIITTRFPVASIERWMGKGYSIIDVDQLAGDSARALLRVQNVKGTDQELDAVIADYGGHALTLDLLAGALAKFFEGEPSKAPPSGVHPAIENVQSARLGKVLGLYEQHLPERELDLLSRLCVFRFGAELDALQSIFLGEDKIAVSGTLAKATRPELEEDLVSLVLMHLVGKDPKGRYTIHPAIRDHFYRRFRDPSAVHQAVREHLVPLSKRPGIGLPSDKESLDLLEELVHHAIQAGSVREAAEIYMGRMGGNDHLNTHLGEYTRSFRILSAFDQCPDKSGMYHCLRAFGRMDEALRWRPNNRYLLLLSGNLSQLSNDPTEATRSIARSLRGEEVRVPDRTPDCPITSSMTHVYRGDLIEAERAANLELKKSQFEDDRVRSEFALAEIERRQGALEDAKVRMNKASTWALNAGSQEHLCLMQLLRARVAIDENAFETASGALDEGTHIARESGFGLWLIEFLTERGRLLMLQKDYEGAETAAQEAFELASSPECRFHYGETEARALLKASFAAQGKTAQG
jgi:hypothetical protein